MAVGLDCPSVLAAQDIPQLDVSPVRRGQRPAVRAERERVDGSAFARERRAQLPGLRLPQFEYADFEVGASRGQELAVGAEGHAPDLVIPTLGSGEEGGLLPSGGQLPPFDG